MNLTRFLSDQGLDLLGFRVLAVLQGYSQESLGIFGCRGFQRDKGFRV